MTALGEFDQMDLGKPIEGVFDVIGRPSSRPRNNCFINNRCAPAEKTINLSTNLAIKGCHLPKNLPEAAFDHLCIDTGNPVSRGQPRLPGLPLRPNRT